VIGSNEWEPFFGGRGRHQGWAQRRGEWVSARRAETQFSVRLRRIARHIQDIIQGLFNPDDPTDPGWNQIQTALQQYEQMIEPWAVRTSARMLADVSRRDAASWHSFGQQINRALREEIATTPTEPALSQLQQSQVHLIRSLPRQAAQRIHQLSLEAVIGGRRWNEIAKDVLNQGNVSIAKANLIARTETSRAATSLLRARAEHVGSVGYIWRTARDKDVRRIHKALEGTFHRWSDPPIAGERGELAHPGQIYNCRCWPEVVLAEGDIARKSGKRPMNPAYLEALRKQGYTTGAVFEE